MPVGSASRASVTRIGAALAHAFVATLAVAALDAQAQEPSAQVASYPARPIRMLIGFPPGAAVDIVARMVGEKLTAKWGQPVVVESRPGAAGNIAAEAVGKAEPDGYTLLTTPPTFVINPSLYPKLGFDAGAFVPVSLVASSPNVLVVHPKVGASSVQALVASARADPGKLNYSSTGNGGTPHLTAELFKSLAGQVQITHVPYKGTQALTALIAGEVDMMFFNLASCLPQIRDGRLKALAVLGERRVATLPDVPAMSEIFPGLVSVAWFGVVAPPKTPAPIAEKLSAAIAEALKSPDVAKRLADLSAEPIGSTPAEMAAFMKEEAERWGAVIRVAGVKVD
jgi:tripartite-type tricarboxylate transporter receptor subunit TctC